MSYDRARARCQISLSRAARITASSTGVRAQLVQNMMNMVAHREGANVQLAGNRRGVPAKGKTPENTALLRCEFDCGNGGCAG